MKKKMMPTLKHSKTKRMRRTLSRMMRNSMRMMKNNIMKAMIRRRSMTTKSIMTRMPNKARTKKMKTTWRCMRRKILSSELLSDSNLLAL